MRVRARSIRSTLSPGAKAGTDMTRTGVAAQWSAQSPGATEVQAQGCWNKRFIGVSMQGFRCGGLGSSPRLMRPRMEATVLEAATPR